MCLQKIIYLFFTGFVLSVVSQDQILEHCKKNFDTYSKIVALTETYDPSSV